MILHQEGNLNNNPNLTGIIECLCERGYLVDYYGFRRNIPQVAPCPGVDMKLFAPLGRTVTNGFVNLDDAMVQNPELTIGFIRHVLPDYDLVIGIDRAIIEADLIARLKGIPYGLISYEIYFLSETNNDFKRVEVNACQGIDFAVCQDDLRSGHLIKENIISPDKMVNIPFAGRRTYAPERCDYLHRELGIPADKKIALTIGSLSQWTMTDFLISSTYQWPEDWVLVVHNRYGLDNDVHTYFRRYGHLKNVYFSTRPAETPAEMKPIVQSADIGIALYKPLENNIWAGKNIQHLGMASGKVSTYLQYGVPVVINIPGELGDYINKFELGALVGTSTFFVPQFTTEQLDAMRQNCHRFYRDRMDLNKTITPLMDRIYRLFHNHSPTSENAVPNNDRAEKIPRMSTQFQG